MSADILIAARPKRHLDEVARLIFDEMGVGDIKLRESSNYPGGLYWCGKAVGISFDFSIVDDEMSHGYDFWMNIAADGVWVERLEWIDGLADYVARFLTSRGFDVARVVGPLCPTARVVRYALNTHSSDHTSQILTSGED